ncbi:U4/U6 small nuclear ribonucleoprotein Prp31, partial [Vespula squamosa]
MCRKQSDFYSTKLSLIVGTSAKILGNTICESIENHYNPLLVLRRKNATLVVAKDTSAARIDASNICTNGHIGQLRTNRPDFPSPNSSESIEEASLYHGCKVAFVRIMENFLISFIMFCYRQLLSETEREAICEACDLELLRLQKYGVLRRKTARIVAAKGTSVARLDASHEITDGYIGQLRIRGPSLTKIVSQKCKTDT